MTACAMPTSALQVIEGIAFKGQINTDDTQLLANIAHSIRLGFPQVKPQDLQTDRVCLVGGGPSLETTFDELRDLYFAGARVVTINGAYHWCLARNIRPSAQIVLDARPSNARFLTPAVPKCHYMVASQCAPETWAVVQDGRPNVWIWHAISPNEETEQVLSAYYLDRWGSIGHGSIGGTTAGIRGIALMRTLGFVRFDLFGMDSCYVEGRGHAYPQPENEADRVHRFTLAPSGHPELARTFLAAGWMAKQVECFLQMIRAKGNDFLIEVHGDGMLAHALNAAAQVSDVDWAIDAAADPGVSSEKG